jgi:GDPmannose 4,6-dehydratase
MENLYGGRIALVCGASGQDGVYLTQQLLDRGYEVHAMCRTSAGEYALLDAIQGDVAATHVADMADAAAIGSLVGLVSPDEIYNLAGSTSVARSWEHPVESADIMGVGPVRLMDAAFRLQNESARPVKFLQASSAEIFGDSQELPQTEETEIRPLTPYGAAKAFAHQMTSVYRQRGLFACSAILYNHESPRRPASFVARKISRAVARISLGFEQSLTLGNMDVYRDWGFAPDYVDGMIRILQADVPEDYVIATGTAYSVREFVASAFKYVGIADWAHHVKVDPALYRPADPLRLVGDSTKLQALGWRPSLDFEELVGVMVQHDIDVAASLLLPVPSGSEESIYGTTLSERD